MRMLNRLAVTAGTASIAVATSSVAAVAAPSSLEADLVSRPSAGVGQAACHGGSFSVPITATFLKIDGASGRTSPVQASGVLTGVFTPIESPWWLQGDAASGTITGRLNVPGDGAVVVQIPPTTAYCGHADDGGMTIDGAWVRDTLGSWSGSGGRHGNVDFYDSHATEQADGPGSGPTEVDYTEILLEHPAA